MYIIEKTVYYTFFIYKGRNNFFVNLVLLLGQEA